jgi:serine/threonine protein kinase
MAPEIVSYDIFLFGYGTEVDWWAFGVCLAQMAFGVSPFDEDTYEKLVHSISLKKPHLPTTADWFCMTPKGTLINLIKKVQRFNTVT